MRTLKVELAERSYPIHIGTGLLAQSELIAKHLPQKRVAVITNTTLRGLYVEAQRRNDPAAARRFAEEAAKSAPGASWASQAVLEDKAGAGDWAAALDLLERMKGSLDRATYRRQRAVLLTARAMSLENSDRDVARVLAVEATKLAPDLVPAATLAATSPNRSRSLLSRTS